MRNTVKRLLSFMLVFSMLFCLAACGGETGGSIDESGKTEDTGEASASSSLGESKKEPDDGEKISGRDSMTIVSAFTDTGTYNPRVGTAQATQVLRHIMEGLVQYIDGQYTPRLAESYQWIDGTTFELVIRDGVYFHNGEKMTIDDVIWSCEGAKESPRSAGAWKKVEKIEKADERTVRFKLSEADVDFMQALSASIMPRAYYEEVGEQGFGLHPVGTGYFMWESYTAGDNVVLKAFDKYWGSHGTLKTLTIRFITENSQALIELENGNVDWMSANGSTLMSVEGNSDVNIVRHNDGLNEYCGFNFNSEKVQNIRVRQALAYCIDSATIVAGAREGIGSESHGLILSYFTNLYNPKVEEYYRQDIGKAQELLAELGYSKDNPLELNLLTDTSTTRTLEAQQIKNAADEAGFKINIKTFESATVTSIIAGGDPNDYDLIIRALGEDPTPTYQIGTIFSLAATEAGNNPLWFNLNSHEKMAEYNGIFQQAKTAIDSDDYAEYLKELQIAEREMVLACWLAGNQLVEVMDAKLRGYVIDGSTISMKDCYFVE